MQNVVTLKIYLYRDFATSVYLSEAQNPIPLPPYTLYTCIHSILIDTGKGGEGWELNQREGERGNREEYRSQSWVENTKITEWTQEINYLQSKNSDKHLPESPFTGQF